MNKGVKVITLLAIVLVLLSCSSGDDFDDFNAGVYITTCDHGCGEFSTCQSSRGDMAEKEKADLSFPFGSVYAEGERDYPEGMKTLDITLTVTVEGEGTVKITVLTNSGEKIVQEATNGNPAVITATVPLTIKKTRGDNIVESAAIDGIRLETVDGPAVDVQANIAVNECSDNWCNKTHPNCQ
jgi:hypothetical protein